MPPYWIAADGVRLGIMARPRGNDWLVDEIRMLRKSGVQVLVSALTPAEEEELGLSAEAQTCKDEGVAFLSVPIEDRSVPASVNEFRSAVDGLRRLLDQGKAIAIHCRAGIGRSAIIAASLLVHSGSSVDAAFRAIEAARGCAVPDTPEQLQWLEKLAYDSGATKPPQALQ